MISYLFKFLPTTVMIIHGAKYIGFLNNVYYKIKYNCITLQIIKIVVKFKYYKSSEN